MADRLASVEIEIARKVGETDALFGSVTNADIAEALAAKGFDIDRRKIQLHDPIKKLGEFKVPVKLHRDVTVTLKVKVVGEGAQKLEVRSQKLEVQVQSRNSRLGDRPASSFSFVAVASL